MGRQKVKIVVELGSTGRRWLRFSLFGIGALALGLALSVAVASRSAGFQPTRAALRSIWEDLKNDTAPALTILDHVSGRIPSQDDDAIFREAAGYLLEDSSVHRCVFARETRWSYPSGVTLASLSLELAGRGTRGRPFDQSAIGDLVSKNRRFLRLGKAPLPDRGVLVSAGVLDDLMSNHEKTWQQDLSERYGGALGYLVFSRPGFTADRKHATIYVELICGATCGGGYYLQLERQSRTWQVISEQERWVS